MTSAPQGNENFYDEDLKSAVMRFQTRHGLNPDGVIGKKTVDAMNVTAGQRLCEIKANMDRLRALDRALSEEHYIIANIPSFSVKAVESGKSVFEMKSIVGTPKNQTPLLSDKMEFVVFSPHWNVPDSIALKEEFEKMREDPSKFKKRGMKVFNQTENGKVEIDYENIDWSQVEAIEFSDNYKIIQNPGEANALGKIKFLFPNLEEVYMHDTPTKSLFTKDLRAFSHGCIRVEQPFDFAEYLLRDYPNWNPEKIKKAADGEKEIFVALKTPVPVYIVYLTAFMANGREEFRTDIYSYNRKIMRKFCAK
jgi:murein L,D-transpeptidase YcbB/YkuD